MPVTDAPQHTIESVCIAKQPAELQREIWG